MEYIRLYFSTSAYTEDRTNNYNEPWVSYRLVVPEKLNYNKTERDALRETPLTFEVFADGNIFWWCSNLAHDPKIIQYKKNDGAWTEIMASSANGGTVISVSSGDTLQFKGDNAYYANQDGWWETCGKFASDGNVRFNAKGNIMSLINSEHFFDLEEFTGIYNFNWFFSNCYGLADAGNLILPATKLSVGCYANMFNSCTNLVTAPELPATTLAESCYGGMFQYCTSLITAPELPATTLAGSCYGSMFYNCTNLMTAPALPATTLASNCYYGMFNNCASLTTAPELPATTLARSCYSSMFSNCTSLTTAPELPATTLTESCYNNMFSFCTSLTTAPALPATTLAIYCYYYMFYNCTGLTAAPELPATTLASNCYYRMFLGCTSLTTAPALPATTLASYCYYGMFNNCTSLTTAPALPATTLVERCYDSMFVGCTSLNYIECLAMVITASNCTNDWVRNVASTGTFVKSPMMSGWTRGASAIPTNWNIQDSDNLKHMPLTFEILSAGTFRWVNSGNTTPAMPATIQYRKNGGNWTSITSSSWGSAPIISVDSGDIVQFIGDNDAYSDRISTTASSYNVFSGATCKFNVKGNIMSLVNSEKFPSYEILYSPRTFTALFATGTGLINANELILPATALSETCYSSMFAGCTGLTTAPELPAIGLAKQCYYQMFLNCKSLTTAPELPAAILAENCYAYMFADCTSLTAAPELPATTLANYCYQYMFNNCTSLNYIKCLATNISATNCTQNWVSGVASTGAFVKAASADWSSKTGNNGIPENWTIQNA